ncbi:MAG TPA: hypothetical protein VM901_01460 [Bdellovibrionota bacterium]|jgi:hypothetical protein|nr:hypothetical protein [Bdellovibrionota bacterium]
MFLASIFGAISGAGAHSLVQEKRPQGEPQACALLLEYVNPQRRRDALKRYGSLISLEEPAYLDGFFKKLRRSLDHSVVRLGNPLVPTVRDPLEPKMLRLSPDLVRLNARFHEEQTARFYADYVSRQHEESFLFMPAYQTYPVPSSDGIVFGPRGEVLANVSLKSSWHSLEKLEEAIAGATRFAVVEEWYEPFIYTRGEELLDLGQWKHLRSVLSLRAHTSWLMGAQFRESGVPPRKTRIVIELMHGYDPEFLNREATRIQSLLWEARDVVESATFINDGDVTVFRPQRQLDDHKLSLGWNRD